MRKRNAIAAIVVSGIMVGGAGVAMGGEATEKSSVSESSVQLRTDKASGLGAQDASGLAVGTVAAATDAVIQQVGDGRITEVRLAQEGGTAVWKVTIDQGKGPIRVTLDATTGEIVESAAATASDDCDTTPGTGTGGAVDDDDDDDDSDDDDDDDADDDDDDGGPVREGVDPNK
ncbi:PepSY domain-containing protein [Streptomyces sp. CWNU-52B]|uniref:PepSY domain-containing protein n=1 Tax=unclassified Streptomyces TaxID=2593676 RepID=UPI0039BF73BC